MQGKTRQNGSRGQFRLSQKWEQGGINNGGLSQQRWDIEGQNHSGHLCVPKIPEEEWRGRDCGMAVPSGV